MTMEISNKALLTDLYQLTMLQSYMERGMEDTAIFEFFIRRTSSNRGFFLFAGLAPLIDYLSDLHFEPWELEWLGKSGRFSSSFVEYLGKLKFTGDVHAMPEGTVGFANEPLVRVSAPLPQAQLIETRLINLLHYQTLVASKAARTVLAASGKPVLDFGCRRAHGAEAAVLAARASYLAGCTSTATVLAGAMYDIPLVGTMAHSFILSHEEESVAFENFSVSHPQHVVLLIDTYDTEKGAQNVVGLASKLKEKGITIQGVRLDSGDLAMHATKVRQILDEGGLTSVDITVSGNLDEYEIQQLVAKQAPINAFAVGTKMTTSADVPYLDCVYKLQEYAGRPCRKRSEGKATWPGPKQVYRYYDHEGRITKDILTLEQDHQGGKALLEPVMRKGKRMFPGLPLQKIRSYVFDQIATLPPMIQDLQPNTTIEVEISSAIKKLAGRLDENSKSGEEII